MLLLCGSPQMQPTCNLLQRLRAYTHRPIYQDPWHFLSLSRWYFLSSSYFVIALFVDVGHLQQRKTWKLSERGWTEENQASPNGRNVAKLEATEAWNFSRLSSGLAMHSQEAKSEQERWFVVALLAKRKLPSISFPVASSRWFLNPLSSFLSRDFQLFPSVQRPSPHSYLLSAPHFSAFFLSVQSRDNQW